MRKRKRTKHSMPQRPREHELDTEAVEYIRSILPSRWTRQEVIQDYGKDLLVEIFEGGEATGLEFRVQSKGHEHFRISHGNRISQPLKVSTLNYFDSLLLPVLLVVYDAQKKQACFLWVKPYIQYVLDREKPDWRKLDGGSFITIHVPLSQVFNESIFQDVLNHVEVEHSRLRFRGGESIGLFRKEKIAEKRFVVSTRLIRPKITQYLPRLRLTDKLLANLIERCVLIQAGAGYGKTWLLQDFIHKTAPSITVWYTFAKEPLDPTLFVEELASELVQKTIEIGKVTLHLLQTRGKEATLDQSLAVLLDEITEAQNQQIVLVMEDLHNLSDATIQSGIAVLLASCPDNLRIILTSRLPLPFGQTKLVAQGQLAIIEQGDLEFSLEETVEIVKTVKNIDLSSEKAQFLHERTGGWIAAVSLAIDALSTNPDQEEEIFKRLTGYRGNIYDFFAEEVYGGLSEDARLILKRLSIVRSIRLEIVNLFTARTDGGQVLKDLARRNTFLVEDQNKNEIYHLHTLFAEFLETRFQDEEGSEAVQQTHRKLANYFVSQREWYSAAEHATDAEEWQIAVQSLEIIGPIGVSSGYGQFLLTWLMKIPQEWRDRSALLCELEGLSALQVGDLDLAAGAFARAKKLYLLQQDSQAEHRLEYYTAEINFDKGVTTPEEFLRTAHRVALWSYQHNEFLFGSQVELRLIQVGQTLTLKYHNLFRDLVHRSEGLVARLESLGSEYDLIIAKVLSSQAHLMFQGITLFFQHSAGKIQLREKLGHPVPMDERISHANIVLEGIQVVWDLYDRAEAIAKGKNEIDWAIIRTSHLTDFAHHLSQIYLIGIVRADEASTEALEIKDETKQQLFRTLAEFDRCAQIFGKFHQMHALAKLLCDAANVYDSLGDLNNRDRLAIEALEIASKSGFAELKQRAEDLLHNQNTLTALREKAAQGIGDSELAGLDEKGRADYVKTILRTFEGNADIDKMRNAVAADVDDMVASAKQRLEWCRHVEIIQDRRHTQSLDTMYRETPKKRIVCMELGHESPYQGLSFDELWPMFKGIYCLGCGSRSLG